MLELSRIYLNELVASHAFNSLIETVIDDADKFSSFSDNNFLCWNAACCVIICRWCEHVIEFRWVSKHFQKKHHEFLSLSAWIRILESLSFEQIIKKNNRTDMLLAEQHSYFSYLIIYSDDHLCMMCDCEYICVKSFIMRKHMIMHDFNNKWNDHVKSQIMILISVFMIFNHFKHYFVMMFLNDLHTVFSSDLNSKALIQNDQSLLLENSFFTQENLFSLWLKFQTHQ